MNVSYSDIDLHVIGGAIDMQVAILLDNKAARTCVLCLMNYLSKGYLQMFLNDTRDFV